MYVSEVEIYDILLMHSQFACSVFTMSNQVNADALLGSRLVCFSSHGSSKMIKTIYGRLQRLADIYTQKFELSRAEIYRV